LLFSKKSRAASPSPLFFFPPNPFSVNVGLAPSSGYDHFFFPSPSTLFMSRPWPRIVPVIASAIFRAPIVSPFSVSFRGVAAPLSSFARSFSFFQNSSAFHETDMDVTQWRCQSNSTSFSGRCFSPLPHLVHRGRASIFPLSLFFGGCSRTYKWCPCAISRHRIPVFLPPTPPEELGPAAFPPLLFPRPSRTVTQNDP